ncbi:hypothetical protein TNCV_1286851 [Trichonephila clavipes]|nr:hypothetical protein TNCV_1286851 [Trichonephila clavipes]
MSLSETVLFFREKIVEMQVKKNLETVDYLSNLVIFLNQERGPFLLRDDRCSISDKRCTVHGWGKVAGSVSHRTRAPKSRTATAGSDAVQSGRPIFDDFFQHLWPYIGNNTAKVVFQMVTRLWLIRIDKWHYIAPQKIV